jgi:microcompartment protein CcmK/EutM
MRLALVVGTVTSTIDHPAFDGRRLLICDHVTPDGEPEGTYVIAIDGIGAGPGETVIVLDEGSSARQMLEMATGPVRAIVAGIVDDVAMDPVLPL